MRFSKCGRCSVDIGKPPGYRPGPYFDVERQQVAGYSNYVIEFPPPSESDAPAREVTRTPVARIDKFLGVGDAGTLVHAADDAWNGESG